MIIINLNFSYPSSDSWIPDPYFGVKIKNIHRAKHGSDSECYDTLGRFVPEKFEEIFDRYDSKGGLDLFELVKMGRDMRNVVDPFGRYLTRVFAAFFEWGTLYLLCAKNGVVPKDGVRRQYDGSLFYAIEDQIKSTKKRDGAMPHGVSYAENMKQYKMQ
ncbi:hypothetical protein HDU93_004678 [Gonapodya sp. JEL0774]|nr:hypothetical protein HDU93_004678 [Gonapodya sp. JEL0774]